MIERVGFFLEIISVILCIYSLYGRKFHIDIQTIIVITVDIILLQAIDEKIIAPQMSWILYLITFLFCIAEFGLHVRELIVNNVLYIVIILILQVVCWMILNCCSFISLNNLKINCFVFFVAVILFPNVNLHRCSIFMQQKMILLRIFLMVIFIFSIYLIFIMKVMTTLSPEHYVVITISLCLLGAVTYMWQKNQYKVREQKMILQMHQLYGEGYQNLITEVRRKQHDFQNHLNTIYSLHYTCSSYEELVRQQEKYMEAIQEENRYSSLLKIGNPVMTGFLYGKFLQAEKREITVIYDVKIGDLECNMPIHKMVEIVGNLFDNEMDAVEENNVEKIIYLYFTELDKTVEFKIKNENEYIPQEKIMKMFKSGESSKGEHRGLGLANVRQICEEYKCDLQVRNDKDDTGKKLYRI